MRDALLLPRTIWRWFVAALFLAGAGVAICGILLVALKSTVATNHSYIVANRTAAAANRELIRQLQRSDARQVAAFAQALRREQVLRQFVLALQRQVHDLGGKPLPLPPSLRTPPPSPGSSSGFGAGPGPTPASGQSPTPRPASPSPGARRSPSPHPSPTATRTCPVPLGPVCPVPSGRK